LAGPAGRRRLRTAYPYQPDDQRRPALFGFAPVSFAARVKKSVKGAVKYISDFEDTAIQLAAEKGYDYVVCGHIHRPQIRNVEAAENGHTVTYMNSGDWVEHLTAWNLPTVNGRFIV
jgi:UDP-2,3-diacylglucosamine pyrophosphatase LpxH